jgi:hypothetical protein
MKTKITRLKAANDTTSHSHRSLAEYRITGRDPRTGKRRTIVVTGTRVYAEGIALGAFGGL